MDSVTQHILQYRYLILFPLAFFEGPIVAFLAGTFVALGYLNIFLAYLVMLLGDIVPDIAYYLFGRYGEQKTLISRYAAKIGIKEEHFDAVRRLWQKHPGKTMFFSKLAYGLSTPFLISAGLVGMPLRRFLRYAIPITVIQYGILLALGYNFGNSFRLVSDTVQVVQIAIGGMIVVVAGYYFLTRYMRRKLLKEEQKEESSN